MTEQKRVLIVDDEEDISTLLRATLSVMGYESASAATGEAAVDYLQRNQPPALVLLDLNLPGMDGLQTLQRTLELIPRQKVVMISCVREAEKIVAAMKLGAVDYLVKPFSNAVLEETLQKYVEDEAVVVQDRHGPIPFVYKSAAMELIRENALRVAASGVPVLVMGESGVGKEVIARFLHYNSKRAEGKFVKVNCAALPADLLESELFGYERGAFTGAAGSRPGKFEVANNGTLFLDEIAEMHPFLQAKLLHVLQDGRYFRLGATTPTDVQVRVIAATNVNVQQALQDGKFRQDLYYRLNVFSIQIPPLRERPEEIPIFIDYFLKKYAPGSTLTVSPQMLARMMEYSWPGNLRELENFIRRLVILQDESAMMAELSPKPGAPEPASTPGKRKPGTALRDLKRATERKAIQEALEKTQWRRKEAAKILNISYKALLYKIRELELT